MSASWLRRRSQAPEEQAALRRVATLVAQAVEPSEVFEAVVDQITRLFDLDATMLVRFDAGGQATILAGKGWRAAGLRPGGSWTPRPGWPIAAARRSGAAARRDDVTSDPPGYLVEVFRTEGLRASVACPITVGGRIWGAISVSSRRGPLPPGMEQRLHDFTDLVAIAIANADSRAENIHLLAEQRALRRLATLVARGAPTVEIFAATLEEIAAVLDADAAILARRDPGGATTVVAAVDGRGEAAGATHGEFQREPAILDALRAGAPARCDDYSEGSGSFLDVMRRMGIQSSVAVPVVVDERVWGALGVATRGARFPAETEQRMSGFAELVATAVGNADRRAEIARLLDEQAALREVATLVALGAPPGEVLAAAAGETRRLFGADDSAVTRFDPDGSSVLVVGAGDQLGSVPAGSRWEPSGDVALAELWRTGRPARVDDSSDGATRGRFRSMVAVPVVVDGRRWGAMVVTTNREPLPHDAEQRIANFGELVATAIANTESRAELTASRARVVAASDHARRRLERDLHDGAQQRLVSLELSLRLARSSLPTALHGVGHEIERVADGLSEVLDGLREIARGIHPAILSEGGLGPALRTLARRSPIPVELDIRTRSRFPDPVEVAAYYVVSEALTNAAKHAHASHVSVTVREQEATLRVSVLDDGIGGADPAKGSGLVGLRDRVEALGGAVDVRSPAREGTLIDITLPVLGD